MHWMLEIEESLKQLYDAIMGKHKDGLRNFWKKKKKVQFFLNSEYAHNCELPFSTLE